MDRWCREGLAEDTWHHAALHVDRKKRMVWNVPLNQTLIYTNGIVSLKANPSCLRRSLKFPCGDFCNSEPWGKAFYALNFRISPQSKHITIQESLMSLDVEDLDQPALYNHPDPWGETSDHIRTRREYVPEQPYSTGWLDYGSRSLYAVLFVGQEEDLWFHYTSERFHFSRPSVPIFLHKQQGWIIRDSFSVKSESRVRNVVIKKPKLYENSTSLDSIQFDISQRKSLQKQEFFTWNWNNNESGRTGKHLKLHLRPRRPEFSHRLLYRNSPLVASTWNDWQRQLIRKHRFFQGAPLKHDSFRSSISSKAPFEPVSLLHFEHVFLIGSRILVPLIGERWFLSCQHIHL